MTSEHLPLEINGVVKRYRQGASVIEALRGVQLTIRPGEFIAIMGASGSGKSTLLHVMAGLTDVDAGQVLVDGRDLATMSDAELTKFRRAQIGLVFQAFNLIPALSAEDNIRLPAPDGPELTAKTVALLKRLGMLERRKHKPGALSGGEQQRIAIARALICDPSVVLADEPTGSLDSVSGQEICRLLRELCDEQGRSIVIVTHEPHVAMWADRVVVLKDGANLTEFSPSGARDAQELAASYQTALSPLAEASR
ncbi:ABC transporter ATP-binding protein [Blastopirellula marina]|uniref:Peptide ABC transporter ATP-binding protein n=1 Tax=Blastopirellula marina TaxID=124 RepID=A0A2S8FA32_9BACT|nr:ABC transporter ATP-binding protein [Blastopirellula marina]PQO29017.1 peptide ABC transporter ATP-binding protein [Blastopirellula marina]PTL42289.1 ABC transporter ATP-binding protein [Blastopirellula marina]